MNGYICEFFFFSMKGESHDLDISVSAGFQDFWLPYCRENQPKLWLNCVYESFI
jgi:hypothetical protein